MRFAFNAVKLYVVTINKKPWTSIDNKIHGSSREVHKGVLLQTEKVPEAGGGDRTCHVFSLEDTAACLNVTDPSGISTIEKKDIQWRQLRMDLHLALCEFYCP